MALPRLLQAPVHPVTLPPSVDVGAPKHHCQHRTGTNPPTPLAVERVETKLITVYVCIRYLSNLRYDWYIRHILLEIDMKYDVVFDPLLFRFITYLIDGGVAAYDLLTSAPSSSSVTFRGLQNTTLNDSRKKPLIDNDFLDDSG
jgi:hypothetical protein